MLFFFLMEQLIRLLLRIPEGFYVTVIIIVIIVRVAFGKELAGVIFGIVFFPFILYGILKLLQALSGFLLINILFHLVLILMDLGIVAAIVIGIVFLVRH